MVRIISYPFCWLVKLLWFRKPYCWYLGENMRLNKLRYDNKESTAVKERSLVPATHLFLSLICLFVSLAPCLSQAQQSAPVALPLNKIPATNNDRSRKQEAVTSVSAAHRGFNSVLATNQQSGEDTERCYEFDLDGTTRLGDCYASEKGPEKPFHHFIPLTNHAMVASSLEDTHFADEILGRLLTTTVGNALAAVNFSQPAAGQLVNTALSYAQNEAQLCQQTHNQFLADLANSPGGESQVKAYLGCIYRLVDPSAAGAAEIGPPCQAIAACQNDTYLSHVESERGDENVLPISFFDSVFETAFQFADNECHPLNPRFEGGYIDEADPASDEEKRRRLLFTDLLFCEYHMNCDAPETPQEEASCRTGLGYEQFLKQYVGNWAVIRFNAQEGAEKNRGVFSVEWQAVKPYTLPWPPDSGEQKPAPEVYPLYRAGEVFTYLTQMMRNQCEYHNQLIGSSMEDKSLERSVLADEGGQTMEIQNGSTTEEVNLTEIRKVGLCGSQQATLAAHRAVLSFPGLTFDEETCDAFWFKTKTHFHSNQNYACDELLGCLDESTATAGGCSWNFAAILSNPSEYPQWVQLLAAYSKVGGELQWKVDLQKLFFQIEQMTRSKDTWYLEKAKELIEGKLTSGLKDNTEVSKQTIKDEIERIIKDKNEARTFVGGSEKSNNEGESGGEQLLG
jgi:hypothetical protein